jgi:hypothetical protein
MTVASQFNVESLARVASLLLKWTWSSQEGMDFAARLEIVYTPIKASCDISNSEHKRRKYRFLSCRDRVVPPSLTGSVEGVALG